MTPTKVIHILIMLYLANYFYCDTVKLILGSLAKINHVYGELIESCIPTVAYILCRNIMDAFFSCIQCK